MRKLITAHAHNNKRTARMLANACKDYLIPLPGLNEDLHNLKPSKSQRQTNDNNLPAGNALVGVCCDHDGILGENLRCLNIKLGNVEDAMELICVIVYTTCSLWYFKTDFQTVKS